MHLTTRKTKLAGALAAALSVTAIGAQGAVQLAPDGLGDAVIIPYYTVRADAATGAPWQTFIRLFNNSENAVAAKVRFREGENSREVLDFVVWLSPYDSWVAWTDANADGAGNPGIRTNDISCTTPARSGDNWPEVPGVSGVRYELFKDSAYSGVYADGGSTGIDRSKEGHVEVIGVASWSPGTQMYQNVTHVPGGEPSCLDVNRFSLGGTPSTDSVSTARDVGNVLAVSTYLIRAQTGQAAGIDPVVLANFSMGSTKDQLRNAQRLIAELVTDDQKPDLDSGTPYSRVTVAPKIFNEGIPSVQALAELVAEIQGVGVREAIDLILSEAASVFDLGLIASVYPDSWNTVTEPLAALGEPVVGEGQNRALARRLPGAVVNGVPVAGEPGWVYPWVRGGVDAVSATITRSKIVNEWARRSDPSAIIKEAATQWVVTFPTKHYYVDIQNDAIATYAPFNRDNIYPTLAALPGQPQAYAPFDQRFQPNGQSCNAFEMSLYDYEENFRTFTSPAPSNIPGLCNETNVVTFGDSKDAIGRDVGLSSNLAIQIDRSLFPNAAATEGWAVMDLRYSVSAGGIPGGAGLGLRGNNFAYYGLPVVGFQLTNYQLDANGHGNFAAATNHRYERDVMFIGDVALPW